MSIIYSTTNETTRYNQTDSTETTSNTDNTERNKNSRTYEGTTNVKQDSVEISKDGQQAWEDSKATVVLKNTETNAESNNSEEISITDLYTMSESQLLQKLNSGNVTQREYNNELVRRGIM